jgi:uncharacterized protein (DUF1697 family)
MKTCIALFRGINVGGNNPLPMKDLRAILERLGAENVRTYLQSGNAVFRRNEAAGALAAKIAAAIRANHGFAPHVFLLDLADLEKAIAANPFPETANDPKSLHVFFLDSTPVNPDVTALERLRQGAERYCLKGNLFYLHAPDGVGRSPLAARAETALGVPATARNWRSVCAILRLAKQ